MKAGHCHQLFQIDGDQEGSLFRGRKKPDYNLCLPCSHIQTLKKAMKVNPSRKSEVEPQRRMAVNTNNLLVTSVAKLAPIVFHWILSVWPRWGGACGLDSIRPSYTIARPALWRGYSSLITQWEHKKTEFRPNRMLPLSWWNKCMPTNMSQQKYRAACVLTNNILSIMINSV